MALAHDRAPGVTASSGALTWPYSTAHSHASHVAAKILGSIIPGACSNDGNDRQAQTPPVGHVPPAYRARCLRFLARADRAGAVLRPFLSLKLKVNRYMQITGTLYDKPLA